MDSFRRHRDPRRVLCDLQKGRLELSSEDEGTEHGTTVGGFWLLRICEARLSSAVFLSCVARQQASTNNRN